MRSSWFMSYWLGTLMLVLLGCRNLGPDLKPPKGAEAFNEPPKEDSQYDKLPPTPPSPDNNSPGKSGNGMGQFKGPGSGGGMGMGGGGPGGGGMGGSRGY